MLLFCILLSISQTVRSFIFSGNEGTKQIFYIWDVVGMTFISILFLLCIYMDVVCSFGMVYLYLKQLL